VSALTINGYVTRSYKGRNQVLFTVPLAYKLWFPSVGVDKQRA